MAKYEITGPDGSRYEVDAPEGATEADVLAFAQQHFASSAGSDTPTPPDGESPDDYSPVLPEGKQGFASGAAFALPGIGPALSQFLDQRSRTEQANSRDNFRAGMGAKFAQTGRGIEQMFTPEPEQDIGGLVSGRAPVDPLQARVDEARRLDAPLLASPSGSAGHTAGMLAESYAGGRLAGAAGSAIPKGTKGLQTIRALLTGAGAAKPAAGAIRTALRETGRQALQGGAAMGAYGATQDVASDETRAGNTATNAAVGALAQGLLGPAAQSGVNLVGWLRGKMAGGKMHHAKALAELEKMGVRNVDPRALAKVVAMHNSGKTDDLAQALRIAETELDSIPIRQAQATRDVTEMGADQRVADMRESQPGRAIVDQWGRATEALNAVPGKRMDAILPGAQDRVAANLGAEIQPGLMRKAEKSEQRIKRLYGKVPEDAALKPAFFNAIPKGDKQPLIAQIRAAAEREHKRGTAKIAPRVLDTINDVEALVSAGKPINFKGEWEPLRAQLSSIYKDGGQEAVIAKRALTAMDNITDRVVNAGGANNAQIAQIIKRARLANRIHTRNFHGDDIIERITSTKWRSGDRGAQALEETGVSDALFGPRGGGAGITFKSAFEKDADLLRKRLGPESDGWKAVRADFLQRLSNNVLGKDEKAAIDYLRANDKRIRKVLDQTDVETVWRLARNKATVNARGKASPSGGAIAALGNAMTAGILGTGGAVLGSAGGIPGGAAGLGAALWGGKTLAGWLRNRGAAKIAAKGAKAVPVRAPRAATPIQSTPIMALMNLLRGQSEESQ